MIRPEFTKRDFSALEAALCWSAEDRRLWEAYVFERELEAVAERSGWLHD